MDPSLLLFLLIGVYFLPVLVAFATRHRNILAIAVLNILLGWTLIGWVVALVWAFIKDRAPKKEIPPGQLATQFRSTIAGGGGTVAAGEKVNLLVDYQSGKVEVIKAEGGAVVGVLPSALTQLAGQALERGRRFSGTVVGVEEAGAVVIFEEIAHGNL